MNKAHDYGWGVANQLSVLDQLGIFTESLPAPPEELPRIYDHQDETRNLDERARAYLHSNCSHCHRKWGGGNAEFQLLSTLPLAKTGTVGVAPGHGDFDLSGAKLLAPGAADRSLILYRMQKLGLGRMPHVASSVVDDQAVRLIRDWIAQLPQQSARETSEPERVQTN